MNDKTKEKFSLPKLTKLGSVEEMTQVKGGPGTGDTFTSEEFSFNGSSSQDVTCPGDPICS